ncbi:GntR family transcriptional regulator [Rhodoblastus sphagnicola]|uniref:GntR family transcriptional regulator n=1 Tax=Rhodoblastus sphagnicola TaxID=333368 RepID=A0A2S6ND78_9HYPH|nr:GntR family transcriptional regulator [Rhodoblastus sphagnicola]MBB4197995.1 DNA-binding GntR family transcriptional regulator [Rhodoblastus sphagnicola]PPQ32568.1 GntR family transcriptional regulator [Rhodoblastus sphagnicola]
MAAAAELKLPALERLPKETTNQWVYRSLRQAVMLGMVAPGRPVTIRDVANILEVSTTPVREALRRLASEQALEERDNRRILVPNMTAARFRELCELRIALECHAAERAMPYMHGQKLDELAAIDKRLDAASDSGDREQTIALNQKFHRFIYEANPNQTVMPLVESVWLQLGPFVRLALSRLKDFYQVDRHFEAMAALRRQDPLGLRIAMEADIRDALTHVGTNELLKAYVESPESVG